MGIEQFVAEHAGVVIAFCGVLVMITMKLIVQPYKQLAKSIDMLAKAVEAIQREIKEGRKEDKTDRENDKRVVGHLLDRMQAQETLCTTTRSFCPNAGGPVLLANRRSELEGRRETDA